MVDLTQELSLLKDAKNVLKKIEEAHSKIPNILLIDEQINNYLQKLENFSKRLLSII